MIRAEKSILTASMLVLTLLGVACIPQSSGTVSKGPRTEDLIINFYTDMDDAYNALKTGEIDIYGWNINEPIYTDAITDPNIALAPVDSFGLYQLDINNNWTIATYPGVRSPTSYQSFRQALAFLVDKDYIVDTICDGFATRIDQPIGAAVHGWTNKSYTGANYPYEFNPEAAATLLDTANFTQGTTPNPNYDPGLSWSAQYLRTYPSDHNIKPDETLDPLVVYVRTDDPRRMGATRLLCDNLRTIGVPVQQNEGPSAYTYDPVMGRMDYHVYPGSWSTGHFPTYIYFLFHSSYWIPYGSNYVSGMNASNLSNYPEFDKLAYNIYYADSADEALTSCRNALGVFTELCINIPLFSASGFWAYRSDLLGVVNMDGYGNENELMFLNAYKIDESPLRWGTIMPPQQLNIIFSTWTYDYQCLNRFYDRADYDMLPYDIVYDQPGFVSNRSVELWDDNGTEKTMITKEFRADNYFVEAGSGVQLENVNVDSYLFTCYLIYALGEWNSWNWGYVADIEFFNKIGDYEVEVFLDDTRWFAIASWPPLLPMSVWLNTTKGLTVQRMDVVIGGGIGSPLGLNQPVWVTSLTSNVTGILTEWVDFRWEQGDFVLLSGHTGEELIVDYYQYGNASGFTPNNLPWREVGSGSGMYYMTGFAPGIDGNFTAKRNPYYYLETPSFGEVDFVWEAGGYYEVTIFDVVKAAGAYGSQGVGVPDQNWFPGADLALPGGVIDIFDIVTIASAYGETFGAPPS